VGEVLPGVGGAKTTVATDLADRVDQDGDTTDDTYASYLANPAHNGRRVITMPIQSEVTGDVLGFGTFFLLDDASYGHTGNSVWCAIYIGQSNIYIATALRMSSAFIESSPYRSIASLLSSWVGFSLAPWREPLSNAFRARVLLSALFLLGEEQWKSLEEGDAALLDSPRRRYLQASVPPLPIIRLTTKDNAR